MTISTGVTAARPRMDQYFEAEVLSADPVKLVMLAPALIPHATFWAPAIPATQMNTRPISIVFIKMIF